MLTELSVQSLKPKAQRYMRADRDGLYIEVVPGGQKYWWYVSQAGGKRKKVSIGKWPDISLKAAREMLVLKKRAAGIATFSPDVPDVLLTEVAEEWFRVEKSGYSEGYQNRIRRWMRDYLIPRFSGRTIASITAPEILEVCRGIEDIRGRTKQPIVCAVCSAKYSNTRHRFMCGAIRRRCCARS